MVSGQWLHFALVARPCGRGVLSVLIIGFAYSGFGIMKFIAPVALGGNVFRWGPELDICGAVARSATGVQVRMRPPFGRIIFVFSGGLY